MKPKSKPRRAKTKLQREGSQILGQNSSLAQSRLPVCARPPAGTAKLNYFATKAFGALQFVKNSVGEAFFWALVVYFVVLVAKVTTPRGEGADLQRALEEDDDSRGIRSINLGVRLILFALHDENFIPTPIRKEYRRNPKPLYRVNGRMLAIIAEKYKSLRALIRQFCPVREKDPEEKFLDLLIGVRRHLEAHPELEPSERAREELADISALADASQTSDGSRTPARNGASARVAKSKTNVISRLGAVGANGRINHQRCAPDNGGDTRPPKANRASQRRSAPRNNTLFLRSPSARNAEAKQTNRRPNRRTAAKP